MVKSSINGSSSSVSSDFFSGRIRDRTTKQSRKAADDLSILRSKSRNPEWKPLNSKGDRVNLNCINAVKARIKLGNTVPDSVAENLMQGSCAASSASEAHIFHEARMGSNPMEEEVKQDVQRRTRILWERNETFEENAAYNNNDRDAEDARHIIQGRDPALVEASKSQHSSSRFSVHRSIAVERRHWVASMQGIQYFQKYGWVYIHSDGSLTMLQQGREIKCRCGSVHAGV